MGFMDSWRAWSQKQYDKWGSKLQPSYSRIDKWELPTWVKTLLSDFWSFLSPELQKKLYKLVFEICKEYDAEFAKELLEKLKELILKFILPNMNKDND